MRTTVTGDPNGRRLRAAVARLRAVAAPGSPPAGADLDRTAAALAATRHPFDVPAYVVAAAAWVTGLDHRCDRPERVAAALLDHLGALVTPAVPAWRVWSAPAPACGDLVRGVREHRTEPDPDVMVLSDALLHVLADERPLDRLRRIDELTGGTLPPAAALHAADSIFYTPEARSSLEGIARLNLARARSTVHPRH